MTSQRLQLAILAAISLGASAVFALALGLAMTTGEAIIIGYISAYLAALGGLCISRLITANSYKMTAFLASAAGYGLALLIAIAVPGPLFEHMLPSLGAAAPAAATVSVMALVASLLIASRLIQTMIERPRAKDLTNSGETPA